MQGTKFFQRRHFMRRIAGLSGIAALGLVPAGVALAAGQRSISALRLSSSGGRARLVFDLDGPVRHTLFTLDSPERIVIDIPYTKLLDARPHGHRQGSLLRRVRSAARNDTDLRVVLDLATRAHPKSFLLKPSGANGYRLVVDLVEKSQASNRHRAAQVADTKDESLRDIVIAIDPGHGGKDPGASGRGGTREKDITLAIARRLEKLLERESGLTPVLTRKRDKFLRLSERVKKAREHKADLFLSIHADSFHDARATGASVYALSVRGASSEAARWLANKENGVDLVGGLSLGDKDDLVASVLLDLSQTATIQSSLDVGGDVLTNLRRIGKVHKKSVQQAGFAVLKSPDIPSILIETSFISNPSEERKLRSPAHQLKLAAALMGGVKGYFSRKAPPGTLFAERQKILG
jgi:N-acetylmuramoyl-L-alanine amidase